LTSSKQGKYFWREIDKPMDVNGCESREKEGKGAKRK
jgi:hypothetical protein